VKELHVDTKRTRLHNIKIRSLREACGRLPIAACSRQSYSPLSSPPLHAAHATDAAYDRMNLWIVDAGAISQSAEEERCAHRR
jgi:hypothetical protein